jgi:hypothetical protein
LVVVMNEGAILHSTWVRREVEEFRRAHPERLVVPIDVGGSIGRHETGGALSNWLGQHGRIWLNEHEDALADGIAGTEIVQRLQVSHRFLRVNTLALTQPGEMNQAYRAFHKTASAIRCWPQRNCSQRVCLWRRSPVSTRGARRAVL